MMSAVHVHAPQPTEAHVDRGPCPDCKRKRSAFVRLFTSWYGWDSTCLNCGRSFTDGEWTALLFCRTARTDSIAAAKRAYRRFHKVAA